MQDHLVAVVLEAAQGSALPCIRVAQEPAAVVIFAGSNDINAGKTSESVVENFKAFVGKVRAALPKRRFDTLLTEDAVGGPPNLVLPEITQATSDVLVKVLAKNPADRYLSYDEFTMALWHARAQLLIQQSTQPPPDSPKSKTSWWRR